MSPAPPCIGGMPSLKKHGVADKNRKYNPVVQVASIEDSDDQNLVIDSLARARAMALSEAGVRKEAARLSNQVVFQRFMTRNASGADRKEYWGTGTDVLRERFFVQKSRFWYGRLHGVPESDGGPQPESRVSQGAGNPLPTEACTDSRPRARWYQLRGLPLVGSECVCPQSNSAFVIARESAKPLAFGLPVHLSRAH